jgi:hypothetical protein
MIQAGDAPNVIRTAIMHNVSSAEKMELFVASMNEERSSRLVERSDW